MSKLSKQLKDLEQKAQNDLFVKEQRRKSKPFEVQQAEKSQLSKNDEKLLIKEEEDNIQDFDPTLIELEPSEEPEDIPTVITTKQTLADTALAPVIKDIVDIKNEANLNKNRIMMNDMIARGNLIPASLLADLYAYVGYNDFQTDINAQTNKDLNDFMIKNPKAKKLSNEQIIKAKLTRRYIPIIYNYNLQQLMNYRDAWINYQADILKKENKAKLQNYVNRIESQNLYSNVVNVQRLPGESDEAYTQRLDTYRNTPSFVNQQKLQLFQREKNKLKQKLLKLMNEVNAQRVINIPEIDEVNIIDINKNFPRFQSEIRGNFNGLKIDDFLDYFKDFIKKVSGRSFKYETLDSKLEDKLNDARDNINRGLSSKLEESREASENINRGLISEIASLGAKVAEITEPIKLEKDTSAWTIEDIKQDVDNLNKLLGGDKAKIKKYKAEAITNISKSKEVMALVNGITDKATKDYLIDILVNNPTTTSFKINTFQNALNPVVADYRNSLLSKGEKKYDTKLKGSQIFGYGISRKGKEFIDFGNLILDINRLTDQNKLRVLYPNHINLKEIKTTAISQNFENIIVQLLETNKLNRSLFDTLDKGEQDLLLLLLQKAGLHSFIKDIDTKRDKEITKHLSNSREKEYSVSKIPKSTIDRWDVVKGMIMAGNDNRNLVKEAINIVNTFKSTGHFSESDCNEQIEYLKSLL